METAPGDEAELMGVGGCEGGCWEPPIPLGIVGPPIGPSLCGLGVTERSSPEAVEKCGVNEGILFFFHKGQLKGKIDSKKKNKGPAKQYRIKNGFLVGDDTVLKVDTTNKWLYYLETAQRNIGKKKQVFT